VPFLAQPALAGERGARPARLCPQDAPPGVRLPDRPESGQGGLREDARGDDEGSQHKGGGETCGHGIEARPARPARMPRGARRRARRRRAGFHRSRQRHLAARRAGATLAGQGGLREDARGDDEGSQHKGGGETWVERDGRAITVTVTPADMGRGRR
jgi:hypothetical protein